MRLNQPYTYTQINNVFFTYYLRNNQNEEDVAENDCDNHNLAIRQQEKQLLKCRAIDYFVGPSAFQVV